MTPNLPVHSHIDLINEFNRNRRIHGTGDPTWTSSSARPLQLEQSNSLVQRLCRSLAAAFGKVHHPQPAQGESLYGAIAHYTPHPH